MKRLEKKNAGWKNRKCFDEQQQGDTRRCSTDNGLYVCRVADVDKVSFLP